MNLPHDETPNKLFQMRHASMGYTLLMTGIKLKIFNLLTEPKPFAQVAKQINGHPRNTMFFLNGLAACGLIKKKDGLYQNLPLAKKFLCRDSSTYLGGVFEFQDKVKESMFNNLPGLILEGPPEKSSETDIGSEKRWAKFSDMLADNARAGAAQQAAALVSEIPEFPGFKKMLDLGGGPGIFGMAMVAKHPSMKGVLFDREPITKIAANYIKEAGMENRISLLAGDFNQDSIGDGYDFIWASSTLNFAGKNLGNLMKKIYEALNPNGLFISFSEGLTQEGTSPAAYVLSTMGGFMTSSMLPLDQGVIADAMVEAGFRSVRSRTIPTCSAWETMDMDIARK